tara:strand:+ start:1106 stop:1381 length:276 start_codon:yes stop_codon:yes gene_type:complete
MYNYSKEQLDKNIVCEIDNFFCEAEVDMVLLSDLGNLLKMEINNKLNLRYNDKVRNINSYIHKTHNSLSKFIKDNTKYRIENIDKSICVLK